MSDRVRSVLLLALLLGVPLHAQERERLERREARLDARLAALQAKVAKGDSLRFIEQPRTVVSVGGFHVAYPEWAADEGREVLPKLVEERRGRYGVALDWLLSDTLFIWVGDVEGSDDDGWADLEWRMGALRGNSRVARSGATGSDWVSWVPSAALEQWAQSLLDPELSRWVGPVTPGTETAVLRDGTVRDLILSPSSRGLRCIEGKIEECALLLELRPVADPLLQAYDSVDRLGLVERMWDNGIAGRARCVQGRDLAECARILQRPDHRPIPATTGSVRQSLFDFALARGGPEGWIGLSRARGKPLADQLQALSGVPIDPLLAEWRRDLRAERRTTAAGLGNGFLTVLIWSIVGSLFFAWRYRWRHV